MMPVICMCTVYSWRAKRKLGFGVWCFGIGGGEGEEVWLQVVVASRGLVFLCGGGRDALQYSNRGGMMMGLRSIKQCLSVWSSIPDEQTNLIWSRWSTGKEKRKLNQKEHCYRIYLLSVLTNKGSRHFIPSNLHTY